MLHATLRTTARRLMPVASGAAKCGARGLATTTPPQNFRVLGVQQIAIGGLDKAPLSHLWSDLLGVPKIGSYKAEKEVREQPQPSLALLYMFVRAPPLVHPQTAPQTH